MKGLRLTWSYVPRRAPGLPPGQRAVAAFPRFSDDPMRAAPPASDPILQISGAGPSVDVDLRATTTEFVERTHDFHCVTTWTYRDVTWSGFALRDVLADDCGLDIADLPPFAKASFGKKAHLRARVALEERHSTLPNWALRVPYRLTVVPTALAAERGLRKSS